MYYVVVVLVCAIRPGCPVGSGIAGVRHALSPRPVPFFRGRRRAVLPTPRYGHRVTRAASRTRRGEAPHRPGP